MTRSQAPKGMDLASWLRLRAERRGQAGVIAGYVHELSDRHGAASRHRTAAAGAGDGTEESGSSGNGGA